jgi:hypothetical protein
VILNFKIINKTRAKKIVNLKIFREFLASEVMLKHDLTVFFSVPCGCQGSNALPQKLAENLGGFGVGNSTANGHVANSEALAITVIICWGNSPNMCRRT